MTAPPPPPARRTHRQPPAVRPRVAGAAGRHRAASWTSNGAADERLFAIAAGAAEVLTDAASLAYLAPLARMFGAVGPRSPGCWRPTAPAAASAGTSSAPTPARAQADMNRPWFEHRLAAALAGVPDLTTGSARPGARIADVGCGGGWSSIALARAYPGARSTESTSTPRRSRWPPPTRPSAGVADRVTFRAATRPRCRRRQYDAVFAFECVHDMPRPVEVLAAVRRALEPGGLRRRDGRGRRRDVRARGDELDRLMYGFSLLICLPDGMSASPAPAPAP